MAKDKKIHNIFLIDQSKVQEKFFKNSENIKPENLVQMIINEANDIYEEQELLQETDMKKFNIKLYFHVDHKRNNLASFCSSFVKEDQKILTFKPKSGSSIMFAWKDKNIFAITTGQGFRVIEDFCVTKFGMLLVGMFNEEFRITALDSNRISSRVHSNKTIYSSEMDFVDIDSLDTIFKEVTGRLNSRTQVHRLLNLNEESRKNSIKITAKNYVKISSSMNFNDVVHFLNEIDNYDFGEIKDTFNLIIPISKKQASDVIEQNNQRVIEIMFDSITSKKTFPFDLFHKLTNEFIESDTYNLKISGMGELEKTEDLSPYKFIKSAYEKYLLKTNSEKSISTFTEFANKATIDSIKGEITQTSGSLLKHISGEINVEGKNYYIFYGDYYLLNEDYSTRLNNILENKLNQNRFENVIRSNWKANENEDIFNEKVANDEGLVHLHKITPDYVEFADLLKIDDDCLTVIHVKDGFDNDMRALDRQVELSMKMVNDLKNDKVYMRKIYDKAKLCEKGKNIQEFFPTANDFFDAFLTRQIKFAIVIRPPEKNLLKNRSNIAKHCLNAMIIRCANQGYELRIQIM